jgi:hypothetical protein
MIVISVALLGLFLSPTHAFAPICRPSLLRLPISSSTTAGSATATSATFRPVIDYFKGEPLESLLPKQDAIAIIHELVSNGALINDSEDVLISNWESLKQKLMKEDRSVGAILGKNTTDRLLKSIETIDGYDPDAVKTFLGSEAVNMLFAKVLYDAIFEFLNKVDVFGNIIGKLPIIGPIRKQIVAETKKSLDRTLGPLVQQFLGTYTKIAVNQGIAFVLSPANTKQFANANVNLVASILERPVNTLLPPAEMSNKLRADAFEYIRNLEPTELDQYVDWVYDFVGDKSVESVVNVDQVLEASPTLQRTLDSLWTRAIAVESE